MGINTNNHGLRLRVLYAQARGESGPITGDIMVLDAGDNKHTLALTELLHRPTNAAAILAAIRREMPACVNVVNKNVLVAEPLQSEGPDPFGDERNSIEPTRGPRL
jgi:hypothetical protein